MKLRWRSMIFAIAALMLGHWLVGCSAKPDPEGLCSLSCSNAIIGSRGFSILRVVEDLSFSCSREGPFSDAITLNFVVVADAPSGRGNETIPVPVRNISFEPNVAGGAPERTHKELLGQSDRPAYGRFAGVFTRPSEWCSDSCGVITLEVFPHCPARGQDHSMSVQVHSGPVFSETYSITITHPD